MKSEVFLNLMQQRRSIREFKSDSVDLVLVENAIKAAGTAPSGANRQPWHFIVVTSQEKKSEIRLQAEKVENEFYNSTHTMDWVEDLKFLKTNAKKEYLSMAPVLILVFMRTNVDKIEVYHRTKRSYYPKESTGLATGILLTALHSSGLGTLTHTPKPMCFLNEMFNLDKTYVPYMIVVTGYPSDSYQPPVVDRKLFSEICTIY